MEGCLHECGVFGIYGHKQAAELTKDGLHMMQHRGQEAAGIATEHEGTLLIHKQSGLVRDIFIEEVLKGLPGSMAIGHNRYSTCGENTEADAQPHLYVTKKGRTIAGASNGDLPFYKELRQRLLDKGYNLNTENDGEAIVALVALYLDQGGDELEAIKKTMIELEGGAYSCVFIIKGKLWAFRDPLGFRPLVLGRLGTAYVVASETCAFDVMGAGYIRDIFPGQIVRIDEDGERSFLGKESKKYALCDFELIYFARPDSKVFGHPVSMIRKRLGAKSWELHPVKAEIVIPVPDSANSIALGFSQASGIPFELGLIRSHYATREFIEPEQTIRDTTSKYKHNPDPEIVGGKRVVMVDDSIVRGTASRRLVRMLRNADAKEVHVRIGSPPIKWSCFYGIDTPTRSELIAYQEKEIEGICQFIEADTLGYLTLPALYECLPDSERGYCSGCFTGKYPCAHKIPAYKLQTV